MERDSRILWRVLVAAALCFELPLRTSKFTPKPGISDGVERGLARNHRANGSISFAGAKELPAIMRER